MTHTKILTKTTRARHLKNQGNSKLDITPLSNTEMGLFFFKRLKKKNKTLIIERIKREKNKMLVIERMKRFPGESSSMSSYWDHTQ